MKGKEMKKYIKCSNCGAEYSYEEEHIMFRDKDEKCCQHCSNVLITWNGSRIYTNFKLLKKYPTSDRQNNKSN